MNDKVYITNAGGRGLSGPYFVETVKEGGKYTLCDGTFKSVESGKEFHENELEFAS